MLWQGVVSLSRSHGVHLSDAAIALRTGFVFVLRSVELIVLSGNPKTHAELVSMRVRPELVMP